MIELNKINIRYDKDLINNGIINIVDGKITGIIGESGVGKTSLLYLIGLISSNKDYRYVYDGISLDLFNEKEISNIKKTNIGYIFQDNSIIEDEIIIKRLYNNCFSIKRLLWATIKTTKKTLSK